MFFTGIYGSTKNLKQPWNLSIAQKVWYIGKCSSHQEKMLFSELFTESFLEEPKMLQQTSKEITFQDNI